MDQHFKLAWFSLQSCLPKGGQVTKSFWTAMSFSTLKRVTVFQRIGGGHEPPKKSWINPTNQTDGPIQPYHEEMWGDTKWLYVDWLETVWRDAQCTFISICVCLPSIGCILLGLAACILKKDHPQWMNTLISLFFKLVSIMVIMVYSDTPNQ